MCLHLPIFELWTTLGCGGTVVLADDLLSWWENLREGIVTNRVHLINTVPSAIAKVIGQARIPDGVIGVNLAGEALKDELTKELWQAGNLKRIFNLYGPTETTVYSTWTTVEAQKKVTIGQGVSNTWLYVMDQELELARFGVVGELYIGGAGVGWGYWGRTSLIAERFLPDAFSVTGKLLGMDLPLRSLRAHPPAARLSLHVAGAARTAVPPLRPASRERHRRLSFAQERLWFLSRFETEARPYNMPVALRLRGPLNSEALHAALRAIVARHEVLRTSFPEADGVAMQHIAPARDLSMPVIE